ncbi:alpha/beta hydrolase [Agromyces kandeliae]|uniref:Alpha/beta hydrolase fold domain-containing protein n=1 Tax=Agromyces kandeliae TaxID=2666141 RepID=A0A6L5R6S1_9MICO|nr:alpha/beta hydrolase [Agromyces kandeliae]MRX45234.1 alpha/beta hydrolase fold domain-containing protein [Agromyces kandeliae]
MATQDHALRANGFDFSVRTYPADAPTGAALVWLHGGAFMGGTVSMPEADQVGARLSALGITVVSVEYTLGPRHALAGPPLPEDGGPGATEEMRAAAIASRRPRSPYPTASLQTVEAFEWTRRMAPEWGADPDRVCLGGASAGGNLSAGAAVRLRDAGGPGPRGLILVYPTLHASLPEPDPELRAFLVDLSPGRDFSPDHVASITETYLAGASPDEVYAFPGGHDMRGMPPTLIVNAERDRLRSSGEAFASDLALAGVDVSVVRERDAIHGFLNTVGDPAGERTLARMAAFVSDSRAS